MLSKDEKEFVKHAINLGSRTSEMAYILMTHRTRTAPISKYDKGNHKPADTLAEFTQLKIEINKVIAHS